MQKNYNFCLTLLPAHSYFFKDFNELQQAGLMDIVADYISKIQKPVKFSARAGDTINVYVRFQESGKDRTQIFSGVVLKIQGQKHTRSFTVRKISHGVGVERTFPLASPAVQKVEVLSRSKVRRSRLFYLRHRKGRSARLQILVDTVAANSEKTADTKPVSAKSNSEKTADTKPVSAKSNSEKTAKTKTAAAKSNSKKTAKTKTTGAKS